MGVLLKINVARVRKKTPKMMTKELPKPPKIEARIATILFLGSKRSVKGPRNRYHKKKVTRVISVKLGPLRLMGGWVP